MIGLARRAILFFWAVWFSLTSFTDLSDYLTKIKLLPSVWIFSSQNYNLVKAALNVYQIQDQTVIMTFFTIVLMFIILIALCFWIALFTSIRKRPGMAYFAFFLSFLFTACFIIWDEVFLQYELEHGHIDRFSFQILTFILFVLLGFLQERKELKERVY